MRGAGGRRREGGGGRGGEGRGGRTGVLNSENDGGIRCQLSLIGNMG